MTSFANGPGPVPTVATPAQIQSIAAPTLFFFECYGHHRDLHSFPTRRSSDLLLLHRRVPPERSQDGALLAELQARECLDLERMPEVESALEGVHLLVGI